jgi:hypothetical protein
LVSRSGFLAKCRRKSFYYWNIGSGWLNKIGTNPKEIFWYSNVLNR